MLTYAVVFLIVFNVLGWAFVAASVLNTARDVAEINRRQLELVAQQNDAQLCAQHDIVIAVRKIGTKLGLPVSDIVPPDVAGIVCP